VIHLFFNAVAASAGGGLTYLRNIAKAAAAEPSVECTFAVTQAFAEQIAHSTNLHVIEVEPRATVAGRFAWEQNQLPRLIARSGADVLVSAGNFSLRHSPVPQILLARNSLYTSRDFYRDLLSRGEYAMWLDTRLKAFLAKRSVRWAEATVAPSRAFANELVCCTGKPVATIYHGFDPDVFFGKSTVAPELESRLVRQNEREFRLLFVSHYNYYRNFETLLRALALLRQRIPVKLLLTCSLADGKKPRSYNAGRAREAIQRLEIADYVLDVGAVRYEDLHHLYKSCDVYVTPAYAESFAHPLVEAMACGLPVIASDIPVHREICGDAAMFFPPFSAEGLTQAVTKLASSAEQVSKMRERGQMRAAEFCWRRHLTELLELSARLLNRPRAVMAVHA
jgi:glycosyltransferase involved in cell wall biosynthesis